MNWWRSILERPNSLSRRSRHIAKQEQECFGIISDPDSRNQLFDNVCIARRDFRLDGGAGRQARLFASAFVPISKKVTLLCTGDGGSHAISNEGFTLCSLETRGGLEAFGERVRYFAARSNSWIHSHEWIDGANSMRLGDGLHKSFLRRMREAMNGFQHIRFLNCLHRRKLCLERASLLSPQLKVVISPSNMCANDLMNEYPDFCGAVHVIHNPINERYLKTPLVARRKTSTLRLGFAGSGWRRKGLSFLLRAIARCDRDVRLSVVGFDKHASQYHALASSLKISVVFCLC